MEAVTGECLSHVDEIFFLCPQMVKGDDLIHFNFIRIHALGLHDLVTSQWPHLLMLEP